MRDKAEFVSNAAFNIGEIHPDLDAAKVGA
jgi:hypothetical protein